MSSPPLRGANNPLAGFEGPLRAGAKERRREGREGMGKNTPSREINVCSYGVVTAQISEVVETLDCSECCQLTQEAFISLARTPIILPRLRRISVPSELTLPNAVFETLANSSCFPALEMIDNIQPGSSVCHPLRCQVRTCHSNISLNFGNSSKMNFKA